MLDFVNPLRANRRLARSGRDTGFDYAWAPKPPPGLQGRGLLGAVKIPPRPGRPRHSWTERGRMGGWDCSFHVPHVVVVNVAGKSA